VLSDLSGDSLAVECGEETLRRIVAYNLAKVRGKRQWLKWRPRRQIKRWPFTGLQPGSRRIGIPHGDTSMSRTVGLPAAIGVKLILQGKINLTGVHTPVIPEIYEPVLEELEQLGIHFTEKWETLEE
jgi:hypothetical protein